MTTAAPEIPSTFDPRSHFPRFYDNPIVQSLGEEERWTISGMLGDPDEDEGRAGGRRSKGKAPIDVQELLRNGRVRGAWEISDSCLISLGTLAERLPTASNCAFYLRAQEDGYAMLDVEPGCPPQIAERLLEIPGIVYEETSMSGRGFHLLVPLPENFHEHEVASRKRVLRERHGWYEILLDHWATFTRQEISAERRHEVATEEPELEAEERQAMARLLTSDALTTVEALYADLAAHARPSASAGAGSLGVPIDAPEIAFETDIVTGMLQDAQPRLKTPADFDNDLSRWEFSVLGTLHRAMESHLTMFRSMGETYGPTEIAWLLYRGAEQTLPVRAKHGEIRNGRPFLLDRAAALVGERIAAEQARQQESASARA